MEEAFQGDWDSLPPSTPSFHPLVRFYERVGRVERKGLVGVRRRRHCFIWSLDEGGIKSGGRKEVKGETGEVLAISRVKMASLKIWQQHTGHQRCTNGALFRVGKYLAFTKRKKLS